MIKRNQSDEILNYLRSGHSLTAVEALERFRCFRLAARINDLRKRGIAIETSESIKNGKRFAVYRLTHKQSTGESSASLCRSL